MCLIKRHIKHFVTQCGTCQYQKNTSGIPVFGHIHHDHQLNKSNIFNILRIKLAQKLTWYFDRGVELKKIKKFRPIPAQAEKGSDCVIGH